MNRCPHCKQEIPEPIPCHQCNDPCEVLRITIDPLDYTEPQLNFCGLECHDRWLQDQKKLEKSVVEAAEEMSAPAQTCSACGAVYSGRYPNCPICQEPS